MRGRIGSTLSSVILFLPNHSCLRFANVSKFSISWSCQLHPLSHVHDKLQAQHTLILFAPNSRFVKLVNCSNPSILEILFCTK